MRRLYNARRTPSRLSFIPIYVFMDKVVVSEVLCNLALYTYITLLVKLIKNEILCYEKTLGNKRFGPSLIFKVSRDEVDLLV